LAAAGIRTQPMTVVTAPALRNGLPGQAAGHPGSRTRAAGQRFGWQPAFEGGQTNGAGRFNSWADCQSAPHGGKAANEWWRFSEAVAGASKGGRRINNPPQVKNLPHNSSRRAKNVMDSSTTPQLFTAPGARRAEGTPGNAPAELRKARGQETWSVRCRAER
jgi:hypothetical protein